MARPIVAAPYYIHARYYSPTPVAQVAPGPLASALRAQIPTCPLDLATAASILLWATHLYRTPCPQGCRSPFHVLPCLPQSVRQSWRPLILGPGLRTICIPYVPIFGDFL
ncbi:uncharacterized protein LAESUDRAFT_731186 [Laetiporus sulphureus 93-53]|uniref:Uncharacterized protein n=1 Tax=Laetiporus sulphureus 93-53 TaxID=1314785 RepID=A0A165BQR7_9APHY|nr:uncharacterized protein LAESUDRAFT_731186 [Laetiporus sulphureus 93-53]KZT01482.1 hypothetical protein LAESUDRAFT_731186 [Laetiporus sulphureus 93-53]